MHLGTCTIIQHMMHGYIYTQSLDPNHQSVENWLSTQLGKTIKNMVKVRLSVDNTKQFKTIAMNEQILECGNLRVSLCKQPL